MKLNHKIFGEIEMSVEELIKYEGSLKSFHEKKDVSEKSDNMTRNGSRRKRRGKGGSVNRWTTAEIEFIMRNLFRGKKFLTESVYLRKRHTDNSIGVIVSRIKNGAAPKSVAKIINEYKGAMIAVNDHPEALIGGSGEEGRHAYTA